MKKFGLISLIMLLLSVIGYAQPRPTERSVLPAAPSAILTTVFKAKYQGGLFGFSETDEGTLRIDDENQRVVFFGKDNKEKFGIPFAALLIVSPQKKVSTATTGKVISMIPLPGSGLASLMREKKRYLVLQFNDPDVDVKGIVDFKIDDKELLRQAIQAIGVKAKLTQRGDTYYRPRNVKQSPGEYSDN